MLCAAKQPTGSPAGAIACMNRSLITLQTSTRVSSLSLKSLQTLTLQSQMRRWARRMSISESQPGWLEYLLKSLLLLLGRWQWSSRLLTSQMALVGSRSQGESVPPLRELLRIRRTLTGQWQVMSSVPKLPQWTFRRSYLTSIRCFSQLLNSQISFGLQSRERIQFSPQVNRARYYFWPILTSLNLCISMYSGRKPSSPQHLWYTLPWQSLTVPSYLMERSSRALISFLCRQPMLEVLTAVSERPSLPAMEWKKNSCGLSPLKKELKTKPRGQGELSCLLKCGRALPSKPWGHLFPSTFWLPRQQTICARLVQEPLERGAIILQILLWCTETLEATIFWTLLRELLRSRLILNSRESSTFLPFWWRFSLMKRGRFLNMWMFLKQSSRILFSSSSRSLSSSLSIRMSAAPTEKPFYISQFSASRCMFMINRCVASGPISTQMLWIIFPEPGPTYSLASEPVMSCPWRIRRPLLSSRFLLLFQEARQAILRDLGRKKLMSCLPDQRGWGRRMQGMGNSMLKRSWKPSTQESISTISSLVKRLSLSEMRQIPRRVSCTTPITGAPFLGLITWLVTEARCLSSVKASTDWGACRFISSPSKSALQGEQTERLRRKVLQGRIRTRCPIMLMRCRVGCRLKSTQSPSSRCLSTTVPQVRCLGRSSSGIWLKKRKLPCFFPTCGWVRNSTFPSLQSRVILSRLNSYITSGTVSLAAMRWGTPTSSRSSWESGLMTVLAEKLTRLPMRFWRNLPSFEVSRSWMLLTLLGLTFFLFMFLESSEGRYCLSSFTVIAAMTFWISS